MSRKKLKQAKNFQGLLNMLARFPSDAVISGATAERVYQAPSGPWDADIVDHVFSEIQRFIDEGNLTQPEVGLLLTNRAGSHWAFGNFDEAIADTEAALAIYQQDPNSGRVVETMRKELRLMREHRSPLDMLD